MFSVKLHIRFLILMLKVQILTKLYVHTITLLINSKNASIKLYYILTIPQGKSLQILNTYQHRPYHNCLNRKII